MARSTAAKERQREYNREYSKRWRLQNRDTTQSLEWRTRASETNKKWRADNAESIRQKRREYYALNKENIVAKAKVWANANKGKTREYVKTWKAKNPEAVKTSRRKHLLRKLYGLAPEQVNQILLDQGGKCAICATQSSGKRGWHVDHCHDTQKVRGILCSNCNLALGHMKDSPAILRSAIRYLSKRGAENIARILKR